MGKVKQMAEVIKQKDMEVQELEMRIKYLSNVVTKLTIELELSNLSGMLNSEDDKQSAPDEPDETDLDHFLDEDGYMNSQHPEYDRVNHILISIDQIVLNTLLNQGDANGTMTDGSIDRKVVSSMSADTMLKLASLREMYLGNK